MRSWETIKKLLKINEKNKSVSPNENIKKKGDVDISGDEKDDDIF